MQSCSKSQHSFPIKATIHANANNIENYPRKFLPFSFIQLRRWRCEKSILDALMRKMSTYVHNNVRSKIFGDFEMGWVHSR